mmetsp:Transcript_109139/g.315330  ORF Transcript_109139/g.315330 Transcript_109139/m.315330 type:complete len:239 (-) Transcript_109139:673-1389(-)
MGPRRRCDGGASSGECSYLHLDVEGEGRMRRMRRCPDLPRLVPRGLRESASMATEDRGLLNRLVAILLLIRVVGYLSAERREGARHVVFQEPALLARLVCARGVVAVALRRDGARDGVVPVARLDKHYHPLRHGADSVGLLHSGRRPGAGEVRCSLVCRQPSDRHRCPVWAEHVYFRHDLAIHAGGDHLGDEGPHAVAEGVCHAVCAVPADSILGRRPWRLLLDGRQERGHDERKFAV